jgi:hypothetical protein
MSPFIRQPYLGEWECTFCDALQWRVRHFCAHVEHQSKWRGDERTHSIFVSHPSLFGTGSHRVAVLNFRLLESRRIDRYLSHYSAAMNERRATMGAIGGHCEVEAGATTECKEAKRVWTPFGTEDFLGREFRQGRA